MVRNVSMPVAAEIRKSQMDADTPLATLRFASAKLDLDIVNQILFRHDPKPYGHSFIRFDNADLEIVAERGVWLASTERLASYKAQDHLIILLDLLVSNVMELLNTIPDVDITFSLLTFDPEFEVSSLPRALIGIITKFGQLVIELPAQGKEIVVTRHSEEVFAV